MWDYVYNGAGVAVGDINNDGLSDIVFSGNQVADQLYLNQGNFKFKNISTGLKFEGKHGWSSGVTMADVNGDGWLDIYICKFEPSKDKSLRKNLLFINNHDLTFTERADEFGLGDTGFSVQASFFDMDNDGDLDCYVVNQPPSNNEDKKQDRLNPGPCGEYTDRLYRNDGNNKFTDVTLKAGIENCAYGLGMVVADINNDGWMDIYISNDYFISDYCYINQKDGTFKDFNKAYFKHQALYSMGVDVADFNNDGFSDVFTADMSAADHYRNKSNMPSMNTQRFADILAAGNNYQFMFNSLQVNNGNGTFSEIAQLAGVAQTDWSWSALWVDIDNDTRKDLFVTNGIKRDIRFVDGLNKVSELLATGKIKLSDILSSAPSQKLKNYAFHNTGDYHFKNTADEWGFGAESFSSGMSYADLDNDGDLDLIVNNVDDAPFIFKNNSKQNYLRLKAHGLGANTFGYGAKATIYMEHPDKLGTEGGKEKQTVELSPTRGFLSSSEPILHFGLAQITKIDSLIVSWGGGKTAKYTNIKANQVLDVFEKDARNPNISEILKISEIFKPQTLNTEGGVFKHKESEYNDFKKEILLPNKMSQMGPALTVGDVNNDGLQDFFIGGAAGQGSHLYVQQANGAFKQQDNLTFDIDKGGEDVKAIFFDANGDGKQDLYVASGSNEFDANSPDLQDRLYINQGNFFIQDVEALPKMPISTGAVCASDFDGDGDLDLFVGGMMQQQKYPYPTRSYLLQNNKGKFTDVTFQNAPDLANIGMVREAIWTDYDNDGDKDLMLVGEWMTIEIFENNKGKLTKANIKGLEKTRGMWHTVIENDFDGDGDMDYMVGNLGLNNKFKKDASKKFHIYSTDFDGNGTNDIVLSKEDSKGNLLPVRGRECSSQQMPFVAQKFPTFDNFAKAKLPEIYTPEKLNAALHYEMNEMGSIYIENKGKGNFEYKLLPTAAQISVISSFEMGDFDKDGKMDVLAVGNKYEAEVETARYDASIGVFLKGDGKGNFEAISPLKTGFSVDGNARIISKIKIKGQNAVIISVNGGEIKMFTY
jgi:hypothetical protein